MTPQLMEFPYQLCSVSELAVEERRYGVRVPIGRLRATALRLAAREYMERDAMSSLASRIRPRLRRQVREEGYGSVILLFVLGAIAGEVIAWVTERFLNWLYPPKSGACSWEAYDCGVRERLAIVKNIQRENRP